MVIINFTTYLMFLFPDVFQSFDVMGVIQAIDFHPYKRLWLAIATK